MAAYRRKKRTNKTLAIIIILIAVITAIFGALYGANDTFREFVDGLGIFSTKAPSVPYIDPEGDEMAVHFIDVGQGDCTLFQTPKGSVLIDCGEPEYGETIIEYLSAQGVEELEYFIITHPDEDHMGSAAYVLENIRVKNFVMNGKEKSTVFFTKALDVVERLKKEGRLNPIIAAPGDVFTVGALQMRILGPYRLDFSEADSNNGSLIIHATYGERAFLLTGDAEEEGEEDLLYHHKNELECDVFAAGHHGSKTSNSQELLEAAKPAYVVISCGEGNSYGHPNQEALDVFASVGATVYRTDKLGHIVFVTDGKELTKK